MVSSMCGKHLMMPTAAGVWGYNNTLIFTATIIHFCSGLGVAGGGWHHSGVPLQFPVVTSLCYEGLPSQRETFQVPGNRCFVFHKLDSREQRRSRRVSMAV